MTYLGFETESLGLGLDLVHSKQHENTVFDLKLHPC